MFDWNSIKSPWNLVSSSGKKRPLPSPSVSNPSPLPCKYLGNVLKAPLDKKRYKVIGLQNGLKICLVSTCLLDTSKESVLSKLKPSLIMKNEYQLLEQEIEMFNKDLVTNQRIAQPQSIAPAAPKSLYSHFPISSPIKIPKLGKSPKGPSSICVCVGAGSLHDPWRTNGLAHFVEHLIFLGSKQYPEPNTLLNKVYENGGIVNAATSLEYTNYYFQCNALAFEECVSILVDSLTNPLFQCTTIKNAIQAIDSEFTSTQAHDTNLMRDFLRSLVTSGHPLRKSCLGNKETLHKSSIVTEVLQWKQRYYRSNYMTVCIQAPMSIEELERFAVKHFSDIPSCPSNWNWKSPSEELMGCGEPYTKQDFQAVYFIAPLTQMNCLMITWALPAKFWKNHACKPLEYIRLLLESTSKGGLKHYLRKKQWISEWGNLSVNRCSRDDYYRNAYCSMFELTILLTDEGYEKKYDVVQAVFSYLKKLRREGVGLHRFEEMQTNIANKFHYQNWEEMLQSGAEIAVNMQRVNKIPHLLTSMTLMTTFNPTMIDEALALMLPRRANFIFASHKNSPGCKETAPYGRIRYSKEEISSEWYSHMEDTEIFKDFAWPEYKHFMPREIFLRTEGTVLKRIGTLHHDKKLTVEYLSDNRTSWVTPRVPTAAVFVHFISTTATNCRVKLAVLEYWTRLLCDRIVAHAGHQFDHHFTFGVKVVDDGITVHVAGPRCHLVELLVLVVQEFFGRCGMDDGIDGGREVAQNLKVDLLQESLNDNYEVEMLSKDILSYIQYESYTRQSEVEDQLKKLLLANGYCQIILDFRREMLVNVKLHGCITTEDLNGIVKLLTGKSHNIVSYSPPKPRASSFQNAGRATMLPVGTSLLPIRAMHPAYVSSVTTSFYQMNGWKGLHARNYVAVIHLLLRRHIVKRLITREQLGYSIRFIPLTNSPLGLCVTVLTLPQKHAPYYVDARIDLFFQQFYEQILKHDNTRMFLKKHCFKGKEGVDKLIVGLENFYRDNLLKGGSNFRKLSIQLQGYLPDTKSDIDCLQTLQYLTVDDEEKRRLKSEGIEMITDIAEFKNSLAKFTAVLN